MEGGSIGHNLKETHPRTIPARFGLIWFRDFRGEDLNVKVYDVRQMPKWWQNLTWPLARWAKNKQSVKHSIFVDWDIEGSFFVCNVHKFAFSQIIQDGLEFQVLGTIWLLDFPDLSRSISPQFVNMTELLAIVVQVGDLTRRKTWFNPPFSWEMPAPSQECVVFQLFRWMIAQMVELLIGFVFFLWTFPFECTLENSTVVIIFIR